MEEILKADVVVSEIGDIPFYYDYVHLCGDIWRDKWNFDSFESFAIINQYIREAIDSRCGAICFYDVEIEKLVADALVFNGYEVIQTKTNRNCLEINLLKISWKHLFNINSFDENTLSKFEKERNLYQLKKHIGKLQNALRNNRKKYDSNLSKLQA